MKAGSHCHRLITCLAMLGGAVSAASAQHAGDVFLQPEGEQVVTGNVNDAGVVESPIVVFAATFGDSGFPGFTQQPGFDSHAGTWSEDARLGWNALDGLHKWTGSAFEPATGTALNVSFSSLSFVVEDMAVPGFDLAVQPGGGFHKHLNFFLLGPGGEDADPGIYLLSLETYSTDPALQPSAPYWIVFDHESPAEHETAIAWVLANLAGADCVQDLDGDDAVGVGDLLTVLDAWGPCADCAADLNADGAVNVADLLELLGAWGPCAEP